MYSIEKTKTVLVYVLFAILILPACNGQKSTNDFSRDWNFMLSEKSSTFEQVSESNSWEKVNIPHDWSVDFPFDSVNGEGCTGYLPGGMGWYSKEFNLSLNTNEKAYILFDGVYNNSEYWLNGEKLGSHPYGYSPFFFDITPYAKKQNKLVVKVDRTRTADSRWYSGSGIYRDVKLIVKNKLQIPIWGTFITTPKVSSNSADINIKIDITNDYDKSQNFSIVAEIIDNSGIAVKTITKENIKLDTEKSTYSLSTTIEKPNLWGVENPYLYTMNTSIVQNGKVVSNNTEDFGIRSFKFDSKNGFFLNGENMKIKGVCLHHDGGLVGAAVPKGVWKRRLNTLKEGGCNAIRISHNPGSKEFLQLCDEMGFLVQDEFFDEWDYPKDKRLNCWEQHDDYSSRGYAEIFADNAEQDLKNTMLSHRNHPCIIQWSIGNEIEWTFPSNRQATGFFDNMSWEGNYFWSQPPYSPEQIKEEYDKLSTDEIHIENTAKKLADWTREMDTTRPITSNCILPSVSFANGYADALDIVGFSYRRVMYDYAKENYPDKVIMGTECLPQWHEWKAVAERPFVSGLFLWTGIDHMGEVHDSWPKKTSAPGLLDQAGFKKPSFHMFKSLWVHEPHIFICSQDANQSRYQVNKEGKVVEKTPGAWEEQTWFWPDLNEHWNYSDNEEVIVEIYSNCEQIELFQNNKSLGIKKLKEFPDHVYKWATNFNSGKLKAVGILDGENVTQSIVTASAPSAIKIDIDNTQLNADGKDVAHIVCQLIDKNGNIVTHANRDIEIEVSGTIKYLGCDNGDSENTQFYKSNTIKTHNGKALFIVQAGYEAGSGTVNVKGLYSEYKNTIEVLKVNN